MCIDFQRLCVCVYLCVASPEVVKNEPYGEKADIWALGCVLYQMTTLQPPFYSSNMLSLASKIVEGVYEPVAEGTFSERVTDMIRWCLSPDPDRRPDIVTVSSRISDIMMRLMDGLYTSQNALQRRADRDRKRAQKYFLERHNSRMSSCQSEQVLHVFQENPPMKSDSLEESSSAACRLNDSEQRASQGEDLILSLLFACPSGSVGICVSQKKLRQIDDPVQRLLKQLHKLVFITQLPPASHHDVRRHLVGRFKKSLFQLGSDPYELKVELSKVRGLPKILQITKYISSKPASVAEDQTAKVPAFGHYPWDGISTKYVPDKYQEVIREVPDKYQVCT
uniref:NIMA-related kinase 10 n=1 Tax=Kryptolebias marmoratus TaxID=37003 RepID=A0A3Q3BBZ6_KRYMA